MSEGIGIDLGTDSTIIYSNTKGIILNEPSIVAVDILTKEPIEYGKKAKAMLGRTPKDITTIEPLKDGVISSFSLTVKMLKHYLKKIGSNKALFQKAMICVPSNINSVEKQAVVDAILRCGIRNVWLIEEPVAAAMGAGLDIFKDKANFIVDIGGGTTDIAVISKGSTILSSSILSSGNDFTEIIRKYMLDRYEIAIGTLTAEDIKFEIGSVITREHMVETKCRGRHTKTGMPVEILLNNAEIEKLLEAEAMKIVNAIKEIIERTPPEMMEEISNNGIYLTGGGSKLFGIDKLIQQYTGINVFIANDPEFCVARGTGKALLNKNFIQ